MAVQWWAGVDMPAALREMNAWASGNVLERRAAIAGLCEPALLTEPDHASAVLPMLDRVTTGVVREENRRGAAFRGLRKALGYCWSVAVVVQPEIGKPAMACWLTCEDRDVRWVLHENLMIITDVMQTIVPLRVEMSARADGIAPARTRAEALRQGSFLFVRWRRAPACPAYRSACDSPARRHVHRNRAC